MRVSELKNQEDLKSLVIEEWGYSYVSDLDCKCN